MTDAELVDRVTIHPDGCWSVYRGTFRARAAYKRLYEIFRGGRKSDVLHHVCENPWCTNPWHLSDITKSEHSRIHPRGLNRVRPTLCSKGHDEWRVTRLGRSCKACERIARKARAR